MTQTSGISTNTTTNVSLMLSVVVWAWTLPLKKEVQSPISPAGFTKSSWRYFIDLAFRPWNFHQRVCSRVFFSEKVYIYIYFSGIALHRECLACPPQDYQDQAYLAWFSASYFTLSLIREICKLGDVTFFGEFCKLGENLSLNLENFS